MRGGLCRQSAWKLLFFWLQVPTHEAAQPSLLSAVVFLSCPNYAGDWMFRLPFITHPFVLLLLNQVVCLLGCRVRIWYVRAIKVRELASGFLCLSLVFLNVLQGRFYAILSEKVKHCLCLQVLGGILSQLKPFYSVWRSLANQFHLIGVHFKQ